MTRRDLLALLLLAGVAVHAPLAATGQDGKKKPAKEKKKAPAKDPEDGKPKEEKKPKPKPKPTPEEKVLKAIGAEFKGGRAASLVARIRTGKKLTVEFKDGSGKKGPFKKDQAKKVLEAWFKKHTIQSLKLDRVKGTLGTFKMTARPKGRDKKVTSTLQITLLKDGKTFYLHKIQER